jgi:predicted MPP superfamily phosphohydrolase
MSHKKTNLPVRVFINLMKYTIFLPFRIAILGLNKLYNSQQDGNWVDITTLPLALPRLPEEFHSYRLVQISDFHIGTWLTRDHLEEAVDLINQLEPDAVAITGDLVTFDPERFAKDLVEELSRLAPRDVCVGVLGNHDHWADPKLMRQIFKEAGIIDLSNKVYTLERGAARLFFAGVDDYYDGLDRLDQVLERLPGDEAAILLAHEPDFADISAETGRFDLQISGHTHGGQINLPVLGPPFLPRYGRKYPSGLYQVNGMVQYTNRGLGTSEMQIRYKCRPEITLFILQAKGAPPPPPNGDHRNEWAKPNRNQKETHLPASQPAKVKNITG